MSVLPSDIVAYGSANMPEADGSAVGGAVDFTRRIAFYDLSAAGTVDVISSSASDTATKITYYGRDPSGAIQTETLTLNGRNWVTGTQPPSVYFTPHCPERAPTARPPIPAVRRRLAMLRWPPMAACSRRAR